MEEEETLLWNEFYDNIWSNSIFWYRTNLRKFTYELQLYLDTEELDCINSKRLEIIKNLKSSAYFQSLTLDKIEKDISGGLKTIFCQSFLSVIVEVKYDQSLSSNECTFDFEAGILTVNSSPYTHTPFPRVDYSKLDRFCPIVEHIANGMLLLELNKMVTEYKNLKNSYQEQEIGDFVIVENKTSNCRKDFSIKQIALIHAYEGKVITKNNAAEYAAGYGYLNKTSGLGLYQDYLQFIKPKLRIAEPTNCTKVTLRNKIELFESVLPNLSEQAKQMAISEIAILQNKYDEAYA